MSSTNGNNDGRVYEFGEFRLDAGKRLLTKADGSIEPLMPKAFETLLCLVSNAGHVLEKDELMSAIWPDTIVEENNLTQNISALRRALGEKHGENRFIATVPGRGYKFVADVVLVSRDPATNGPETVPDQYGSDPQWWRSRAVFLTLAALVFVVLAVMGFYVTRQESGGGLKVRSLAVLPLKPLVVENRDESLEMGIADELIRKLSGSEQLSVRSLAVVRRFRSPEQDPLEAGRQLGVEAVFEGNVQIVDNKIRISARLLKVSDGTQLWAGRFDQPKGDVLRLQNSISESIAAALKIPLGTRTARDYTQSVEAYQHYINGRLHAFRLVGPEALTAIAYYEKAIESDPGYTLAYIGLANSYRSLVLSSDHDPRDVMPKAKAAALKAVELDPDLSEARVALANSYFWDEWDWPSAEKHFREAISLDPQNPTAHMFYAHFLSNTGRHEQAIAEVRNGRALEPVNLLAMAVEGQVLMFAGRNDEALGVLTQSVEKDPTFWLAHLFLARLYATAEMYEESIKAGETAETLSGGSAEALSMVAYSMARSGNRAGARRILLELEERAKTRYVPAYTIAGIYNALGDKDNTFKMLERSFHNKDALMVFLKVEPKWDNLRSEPRFIDLINKMKL